VHIYFASFERIRCRKSIRRQRLSRLRGADRDAIRRAARTGRPLGSAAFVADLESRTGRKLARQKPGRKSGVATEK
jgi:hypothetical protein